MGIDSVPPLQEEQNREQLLNKLKQKILSGSALESRLELDSDLTGERKKEGLELIWSKTEDGGPLRIKLDGSYEEIKNYAGGRSLVDPLGGNEGSKKYTGAESAIVQIVKLIAKHGNPSELLYSDSSSSSKEKDKHHKEQNETYSFSELEEVVLEGARKLSPDYSDMSIQDIEKDLKVEKIEWSPQFTGSIEQTRTRLNEMNSNIPEGESLWRFPSVSEVKEALTFKKTPEFKNYSGYYGRGSYLLAETEVGEIFGIDGEDGDAQKALTNNYGYITRFIRDKKRIS